MPKSSIRQPLIISFTYDYANRRVGKRVQEKTGGQWRERYHHLYVYNGTQPVAEIDATTRRVLRTFAWGATGELLMIHDRTNTASPQTYLPVRDASGSVTALVRDDGNGTTIVAVYEYDPNGNLLRAQGEYAKKNPFTFGDGWMDWETGLVSAGSVYYSARLGRYINSGPSGAGDGLVAYYGVAPTVSCLPLRQYARPEALLRFADPGFTIDSPEWLAYEAALAAAEAESVAQDGYLGHNLPWEPTETEDNLAEEFIAEAKHFQFTSVLGSIDHGLSDAYLIGTDPRKGGAYIEYYSDGSMMAVNTLGSTLLIENDGTATLNFSNTQLSIIQAPISEGTIGAGKNKTDRNISSTYPFFQERRGSCVVASLRNVIYAYKGDAPTEAALRTKIANFLGIKESVFDADGLMFGDAKRAIRHILDDYGLNASYHSSPSDIEHAVRLGGPFIVFTRNESSQDSDYATVHAITTWFMPYNQLTYTIDSERPNSRATTGTAEWLSTGEYYQKWNTMGSNVIWPRRTQ